MLSVFIILRGNPVIGILGFAIILVVVIVTYVYSRKAIVRRELRKAGVKKICDFGVADSGKIIGRVVFAGKIFQAPLSKRWCSYCHIVVESDDKHQTKLIDVEEKGDVIIYDGTGYALVDTDKTISYLVPDAKYSSGIFNDATHELEDFLSRHQIKSKGIFGLNKALRYREGILEKDEPVTVSGEGRWTETKNHKLDLPTAKVLVITSFQGKKVFLSDDPVTLEEGG